MKYLLILNNNKKKHGKTSHPHHRLGMRMMGRTTPFLFFGRLPLDNNNNGIRICRRIRVRWKGKGKEVVQMPPHKI
jgi:hypothetical protein